MNEIIECSGIIFSLSIAYLAYLIVSFNRILKGIEYINKLPSFEIWNDQKAEEIIKISEKENHDI